MKKQKQILCRYCGAPIVMIKTTRNKTTPCNAGLEKIDCLPSLLIPHAIPADAAPGFGYIPHKYTCANYKNKPCKTANKNSESVNNSDKAVNFSNCGEDCPCVTNYPFSCGDCPHIGQGGGGNE